MQNFEVVIGIEIHLELNTKTKMFSRSANNFHSDPNTNVSPLDLGYPGTLPVLNKHAVYKAIQLAKALEMTIDDEIHFDRKNYFYFDLPKGYQITQQFRPIARGGKLPIGEGKFVSISHFHLEEDTAKVLHQNGQIKLDYNRSGVPLIEIVSAPVMHEAAEALAYIETIRQVALMLGISDAKMEEGSLRADINLSLRPYGASKLGTKVEIKNLNSLSNVKAAIEAEIKAQTKSLLRGEPIIEATKRYDEATGQTKIMRLKTKVIDYKYFPEPNINALKLDKAFIERVKVAELPWAAARRYQSYGLDQHYINTLLSYYDYAINFDKLQHNDKVSACKIFFAEIVPLANAQGKSVSDLAIDFGEIDIALDYLQAKTISGKQLKDIIPAIVNTKESTEAIMTRLNMRQIVDEQMLTNLIQTIMDEHKPFMQENIDRPERLMKFLTGQLMKMTNGQANPIISSKILKKAIDEYDKQKT